MAENVDSSTNQGASVDGELNNTHSPAGTVAMGLMTVHDELILTSEQLMDDGSGSAQEQRHSASGAEGLA